MVYGEGQGQRSRRTEEQEAMFKRYKCELKNMLVVSKSGICHQALKFQLEEMIGKRIPTLEMGFNTWSQFLYECKDILEVGVLRVYSTTSSQKKFVFIREYSIDPSIAAVHKLVKEQDRGKPKKTWDGTPREPTRNQCAIVDASQLLSGTTNGVSNFSRSSIGTTQSRGPRGVLPAPVSGYSGYGSRSTNSYQPKKSVLRSGYQSQRPSANPFAPSNNVASSGPPKSYSSTGPSKPMALPPGLVDDDDDDYVGDDDDCGGFDYCSGLPAPKVAVNSAPKVNTAPKTPPSATKENQIPSENAQPIPLMDCLLYVPPHCRTGVTESSSGNRNRLTTGAINLIRNSLPTSADHSIADISVEKPSWPAETNTNTATADEVDHSLIAVGYKHPSVFDRVGSTPWKIIEERMRSHPIANAKSHSLAPARSVFDRLEPKLSKTVLEEDMRSDLIANYKSTSQTRCVFDRLGSNPLKTIEEGMRSDSMTYSQARNFDNMNYQQNGATRDDKTDNSTRVKRLNFLDLPVRPSSSENPEARSSPSRASEYPPLNEKPKLHKTNGMINGGRNHSYRDTRGNENIRVVKDDFITKVKRLNLSDLPVRLPSPPTVESKAEPPLPQKKVELPPATKKLVSEESSIPAISTSLNNKPTTIKKVPLSFDAPPFVPLSFKPSAETNANENVIKIQNQNPRPIPAEIPKPIPAEVSKPGPGEIMKPRLIPGEMSPAPAMVLRKGQVCQISVLKFERAPEYDMIMRLFKHVGPINQLESEMTNFYESAAGNEMHVTTEILEEGFYAVFHDGKWVRANLQKNTKVSVPIIPVFLLDHGKFLPVTDMKHLRHLKVEFTKIRRTVYFAKLLNTELDVDKFRKNLNMVGAPHVTFQGAVTSDQSNVPVVFVDVKDY